MALVQLSCFSPSALVTILLTFLASLVSGLLQIGSLVFPISPCVKLDKSSPQNQAKVFLVGMEVSTFRMYTPRTKCLPNPNNSQFNAFSSSHRMVMALQASHARTCPLPLPLPLTPVAFPPRSPLFLLTARGSPCMPYVSITSYMLPYHLQSRTPSPRPLTPGVSSCSHTATLSLWPNSSVSPSMTRSTVLESFESPQDILSLCITSIPHLPLTHIVPSRQPLSESVTISSVSMVDDAPLPIPPSFAPAVFITHTHLVGSLSSVGFGSRRTLPPSHPLSRLLFLPRYVRFLYWVYRCHYNHLSIGW